MVELGKTGDVQNSWESVSKCDLDFSYFSVLEFLFSNFTRHLVFAPNLWGTLL